MVPYLHNKKEDDIFMALNVSEKEFDEQVLQSKVPVLVDFWAPWCGPCISMAPIIEQVASDFNGRAKVCKVNVDESQALAGQFRIMSIPTLLFFKDGEVKGQLVGYTAKNVLSKKLEDLLEN